MFLWRAAGTWPLRPLVLARSLSPSAVSGKKSRALPPRPMHYIKEHELEEKFVKGSGPGGQKINKCNSKVQIKHVPSGIIVESQHFRNQSKNRTRAREILAMRLEQLEHPTTCRLAVVEAVKARTKANRAKKAQKKKEKLEKKQEKTQKHSGSEQYFAQLLEEKRNWVISSGLKWPIPDLDEVIDELLMESKRMAEADQVQDEVPEQKEKKLTGEKRRLARQESRKKEAEENRLKKLRDREIRRSREGNLLSVSRRPQKEL